VTGGTRGVERDLYELYYLDDQIKSNEMGGACSAYRGQERFRERPNGKRPLEDLSVDGKIILKWIFKE
jgi:hypothetical protein